MRVRVRLTVTVTVTLALTPAREGDLALDALQLGHLLRELSNLRTTTTTAKAIVLRIAALVHYICYHIHARRAQDSRRLDQP